MEGTLDALSFGVLDLVPTCEADVKSKKETLDKTLEQAVNAYQGMGF